MLRATPRRDLLFGSSNAYGKLWIGSLWPRGVVTITPDNVDAAGRLEMALEAAVGLHDCTATLAREGG